MILFSCLPLAAKADVTAEQVNTAINNGVAFLEKQQRPDGRFYEYESEPGGGTALCTLALLNCGRNPKEHESVRKALAWLEKQPDPERTYASSLMIMAFVQADAKKYALTIKKLALALSARQMRDERTKGGWSYKGPQDGNSDNSNTQFAMLALQEAEKAGVKIPDQTWQLALNYWTQPGMQNLAGGYGYGLNQQNATGSMTCAAIASLIIARDRLHGADASVVDGRIQCCGSQPDNEPLARAMQWMGDHFSVTRNPNHPSSGWLLYYLYALERVGRMSGQRFFMTTRGPGNRPIDAPQQHDWYREGCEFVVKNQDKLNHAWVGVGTGEGTPEIGTALALLFLSKGRRPVVMAKLQHHPDVRMGSADWDHHRRAVQNLTMRVEKKWQRDLSWQTIDFTRHGPRETLQVTSADLLEAPVVFLSGSQALDLSQEQQRVLKEYLENGGFLFAEACDGNGCNGAAFDRSFRALMVELFPDSELRQLPADHAVWYAQEKVDPQHLPKDPEFWLWGLDTCCRTSVVYCPRSLSCYWELAHPYRDNEHPAGVKDEIEQVARIGSNVLAYATNRELKEKLERPQVLATRNSGRTPRWVLSVPKLSHGGGADDAPGALSNLLLVMEQQPKIRVDLEKRLLAPTDPKLLDYPIAFMHGRRQFRFSAAEREALKKYLDNGGFLFADAICASKESPQVHEAFDLAQEPAAVRDRYGRHRHGQSVLLARRLVEAGTRFVTIYWGNEEQDWADGRGARLANNPWDTHRNHFPLTKDSLCPRADQALAALIDDLASRGLLESTLVIWMGDFGRTPYISKPWASRDHWPHAFTILLAGAGVRAGEIYGRTDRHAAEVVDQPVSPADLTATIFAALGAEPHATIPAANGAAHRLSTGRVVDEWFA